MIGRAETSGNNLFLTGQLDRALYVKTNKIIEACGGKWSKKEKAHVFESDASDRISQILMTGEVEIPKDEFNFFPTPPDLVSTMIHNAEIKSGMRVLEPSAGRGAIANACADLGAIVDCYELMQENYLVLSENSKLRKVVQMDFLECQPEAVYDRVMMNPPFMKQLDIKHVLHAFKFLKPGGMLVAIMSASVVFRQNSLTVGFRELVHNQGGFITELPAGSFKASGTMVNTVMVTIPAE